MAPIPTYGKVSLHCQEMFIFGQLMKLTDKNKSKTVYTDNNGKALVKGSRSYPEDLMTSGKVGRRKGEVANGVEQRRTQDDGFD
jgi:hypothetical protein